MKTPNLKKRGYLVIAPTIPLIAAMIMVGVGVWTGIPRDIFTKYPNNEQSTLLLYKANWTERQKEQPITYASSSSCPQCHQEKQAEKERSSHKAVGCQGCHGPGGNHALSPEKGLLVISEDPCLVCHSADSAKPVGFPQLSVVTHKGQVQCMTCHNPHQPEVKAVPKMIHQVFKGAGCSTCHGPQGSPRPLPATHNSRPEEVCLICHKS